MQRKLNEVGFIFMFENVDMSEKCEQFDSGKNGQGENDQTILWGFLFR